jgi:hypothetical protein
LSDIQLTLESMIPVPKYSSEPGLGNLVNMPTFEDWSTKVKQTEVLDQYTKCGFFLFINFIAKFNTNSYLGNGKTYLIT